jgi:hypothetical protein
MTNKPGVAYPTIQFVPWFGKKADYNPIKASSTK